jgi:hypothetical protein
MVDSLHTGRPLEGRRSIRRDRTVAVLMIIVFLLSPVLFMFVGPIWLKIYDAAHPIRVTCQVRSAESGSGSSHSLKGIGSSNNQVIIDTKDCGTLVLVWHVSEENRDAIARRMQTGGPFSFRVGSGSFHLRDQLAWVNQAVYVRDIRRG